MSAPWLVRLHVSALAAAFALVPVGEGAALAAFGLLAVLTWVRRPRLDELIAQEPLRTAGLCFLLWLGFGVLAVILGGEGVQKPGELGRHAPMLLLALMPLAASSLGRSALARAMRWFFILLAIACVFGLVQYVFNIRPGEALSRLQSSVSTQSKVPGQFDRSVAGGFYFHRLKMAHVLVVGCALLVARQLFASFAPKRRLAEGALLALFLVTTLFTYTRGALLAMVVAAAACLPFASKRLFRAALLCVALGAVGAAFVPSVRARVLSIGAAETSDVRALIWAQAARMLGDHPFGVGLGNYPAVVSRYYDTSDPAFTVRTYPHSVLLAAWAEAGPLGGLAFLSAFAVFIVACAARLRASTEEATRIAAATGLFATVAMLAIGVTHDVFFHNCVALAYFALMGTVLVYLREQPA